MFWGSRFIYYALKKSGTKDASERKTAARFGLFSSSIQASIAPAHLLFVCNLVARSTDRQTGRAAWVGGWVDGWSGVFFGRIGDVEEMSLRCSLRLSSRKKKRRCALGHISCPLLYQDFNLFFLQTGIEVDFKSFLELMLFIPLFCSILSALFSRIIRTVLAICNTRSLC